MSKPASTLHTAVAVHGALTDMFHIGDLMWLHMALAMFLLMGGKLVNWRRRKLAGKLALRFMISDTDVLFKPFLFQHFLTKDLHSLPHPAGSLHAHLQGQRKMILWFWHWVSQPYLA